MSLSNYLENAILNKVCRGTDFTVTAVYCQLHTADPGETCTTAAAGETTRKVVTFGSAATSGVCSNTADIDWTSVSTTETYSHVSLWDAVSSGNALGSGGLTTPRAVTAGDNFKIPIGDLDFTMD